MIVLVIAVVAFLIFVNALYVGAEFATVSSRRARVAELAEQGNAAAVALEPILEDRAKLDRYVAACQVGITLSSLLVGYYGQAQLTPYVLPLLARAGLSEGVARPVTATTLLLLLTFLQVVLGELVPKSVALRYPERASLLLLRPMRWSLIVLGPLISLLNGSALLVLRRFGRDSLEEGHVHHPDELETIFRESAEGGLLDAGEREMLSNVFHLSQRVARQIMVPRTRILAVPLDADPAALLRELVHSPFTRFPVYEGRIDDLRGMVHIRDLYTLTREGAGPGIEAVVRPLPVLPEFLSVTDVWARLRSERASMAAVFDEYGSVTGIITLEDVLEELFGEMQDEFDRELELFREEPSGSVALRGDVLVSEINGRYGVELPEGPADTVGGLVMDLLERVAREGDVVEVKGVRLEVTEARRRAVARVSMTRLGAGDGEGGNSEDTATGGGSVPGKKGGPGGG